MAKVLKHYVNNDEVCGRIENEHFVIIKKYDKLILHDQLANIVKTINDFPVNMNLRLRFGIYLTDGTKMSMHAMINRAILAVDTIRADMEDIWHIMTKRYGKSRYMSRRY